RGRCRHPRRLRSDPERDRRDRHVELQPVPARLAAVAGAPMIVSGERQFDAPRETVWRVLNDPASMAQTMPGVESFDVHDERRWSANVKIPLGLGGLKMKVDMEKIEERELEHAALKMKGTGVGAMLSMQTKFDLADA